MDRIAELEERIAVEKDLALSQIQNYQEKGLRVFASSSFQTHSIPMLHLLSELAVPVPIYFIQTGFHFPETLEYRNTVARKLQLEVRSVRSPISLSQQMGNQGKMLFAVNPDRCCHFNKILPMQEALAKHDVWINGVRRDQNANRSSFEMEEQTGDGKLRFHPMLQWTREMIDHYCEIHQLPVHPLGYEGYVSIGCQPCTRGPESYESYDEREGRWSGMNKTECGLHTELIQK